MRVIFTVWSLISAIRRGVSQSADPQTHTCKLPLRVHVLGARAYPTARWDPLHEGDLIEIIVNLVFSYFSWSESRKMLPFWPADWPAARLAEELPFWPAARPPARPGGALPRGGRPRAMHVGGDR